MGHSPAPRPSSLIFTALITALLCLGSGQAVARSFPIDPGQNAVGRVETYITRDEDTLLDVARSYDLGFTELMASNHGIDPWVPHAGKRIVVPAFFLLPNVPHQGIVINLVRQRLYYFPPGGKTVETYPVGVGAEGKTTPLGITKIASKRAHPTWYPPPSILAEDPELPKVVPPGPDNPMGDFALYLAWPSYTIHGTDKPYGVGRNSSHGCMRLYPEDIEQLFGAATVGTPVRVIDQDVEAAWLGNDLYLAVFPTKAQAEEIALGHDPTPLMPDGLREYLTPIAGTQLDRIDWRLVEKVGIERSGIPTRVTMPAMDPLVAPY
jgi:L,D-transpeptidase ErfK/SrfK